MTSTAMAVPDDEDRRNLMPIGNPSMGELDTIMRLADILAGSSIVPREYQRQPGNIVAAGLMGRAFGWDASVAMRMITVIQGTATLKPEAMLALVRQRGHSVTLEQHADGKGVTVRGKRCDTGDEGSASFTIADAERAGLTRNGTWKAYPLDMCQWRAVSRLSRQLFGDVVLGAGYTPEEIALSRGSSEYTVERTGEIAPRDFLAELEFTDDIDSLRQLHQEASSHRAPSEVLEAIISKGKSLKEEAVEDVVEAEIVDEQLGGEFPPSSAEEVK